MGFLPCRRPSPPPLQDAIDLGWLQDATSGMPNVLAVLLTAREIASGMAYLHSSGALHGDLSAFNVLLASATGGEEAGGRHFTAKVGCY